jgi:hypothetical protein
MSRDKDKDPREKYRPPLVRELFDEDDNDEKPEKQKRRRGRPVELTRRLIKNIAFHIMGGATAEIATLMTGVSRSGFYKWRDRGRRARASTNPLEREENEIYIEFVDTCDEAKANHIGLLENISTRASEKNVQAAHWRLERMDRIKAMVEGRKEKRRAEKEAAKAAAKAAAENAAGGVGGFKFYVPTKDGEPLDVVCSKCKEEFDAERKCKCTRGSPLQRLRSGETLPIELLKQLGELVGVEVDEKDPQGTAERIRKELGEPQ